MRKLTLILSIDLFFMAACTQKNAGPYTDQQPIESQDGLSAGTLQVVRQDTGKLESAVTEVWSGKYGDVHSLLI